MFPEVLIPVELGTTGALKNKYGWAAEKGPHVKLDYRRHLFLGREISFVVILQPRGEGNEIEIFGKLFPTVHNDG